MLLIASFAIVMDMEQICEILRSKAILFSKYAPVGAYSTFGYIRCVNLDRGLT